MKRLFPFLLTGLIGGCAGFSLCYCWLMKPTPTHPPQSIVLQGSPHEPLTWQPRQVLPVLPPKIAGQ
jgi:hypothetical protein